MIELRMKAAEAKSHGDDEGLRAIAALAEEIAGRDDLTRDWHRGAAQSLAADTRDAADATRAIDAESVVESQQSVPPVGDEAMRILRERYARGELTREEFQQLRADVADSFT